MNKYIRILACTAIFAITGYLSMNYAMALNFGTIPDDITTTGTLNNAISNIIKWLLSFLAVIAVLIGIWGGFLILTSTGDEERVKKGWKAIMYMVIGVVVIFLVGPLVKWLFVDILKVGGA